MKCPNEPAGDCVPIIVVTQVEELAQPIQPTVRGWEWERQHAPSTFESDRGIRRDPPSVAGDLNDLPIVIDQIEVDGRFTFCHTNKDVTRRPIDSGAGFQDVDGVANR
jgi:hypothetical protein